MFSGIITSGGKSSPVEKITSKRTGSCQSQSSHILCPRRRPQRYPIGTTKSHFSGVGTNDIPDIFLFINRFSVFLLELRSGTTVMHDIITTPPLWRCYVGVRTCVEVVETGPHVHGAPNRGENVRLDPEEIIKVKPTRWDPTGYVERGTHRILQNSCLVVLLRTRPSISFCSNRGRYACILPS